MRIKEINRELTKLGFVEGIPMIMIGLSVSTKITEGGNPAFEFLENEFIVNGMLTISAPVVLWCVIRTIKLALEKKKLEKSANL